jgi:hypothetical protein
MGNYTKEQILDAKREVIRAQVERFHNTYHSYFNRQETVRMVEFFFEKVYNLDGKQEWVDIAINGFEKVKSLTKESTRESIEQLIELNHSIERMDTLMANLLLEKGWAVGKQLSQDEFNSLFIECGHADERKNQLNYVLKNLVQFYELAHRPINAVILKPAKMMSKILGLYPLIAIVEEGYYACLPVSRDIFTNFYKEVERKEWEYLLQCFPELQQDYERNQKA